MKEIPRDDYHYIFRPLRLYREDIDEVRGMLEKRCGQITISDESYIYNSLDEMKSRRGPRVHLLKLGAKNPYVSLSLGARKISRLYRDDSNSLYVSDGSNENEYLFLKVRDYLRTREAQLPRFVNFWGILLVGLLVLPLNHLISHSHISALSRSIGATIVFCSLILYDLLFFVYASKGFSIVSLEPRKGHPSFWARNRDELVRTIIAAIIGGAITLLIQWIISSLRSSK